MDWLLEERIARQFRKAEEAGLMPTAEQLERFEKQQAEAEAAGAQDGFPRNATLTDDTVEIRIHGVLTKRPSFFAMFFGGGGTTYTSIIDALAMAQADARVKRVVLDIDSPGGNVDGLFDLLAAIESFKEDKDKELIVRASNAMSAAFGIAAAAGKIEAQSVGSMFGSVGVAVSFFNSDMFVDITNTESPNKRPDLNTEKGRAVVVDELDAIFDLFVDAIARGRGTTVKSVIKTFGRGSTLLAGDALERGMIDSLRGAPPNLRAITGGAGDRVEARPLPDGASPATDLRVAPATHQSVAESTATPGPTAVGGGVKEQERENMDEIKDLATLRSRHPDLYAAAVAEGVKSERDRVTAHLTLGRQAADLKLAGEGIESGEELNQTWQAKYMAAGMNRNDRQTRQAETDGAGAIVDNATKVDETKTEDMGDKVVALMEKGRTAA